ncbi:MAG TPA: glutathione S-transferase family protein [Burkholderiales bacterium]|nr:glutathione S-transferase family protein [Burkholderiales bacterium]
MLKIYGRARSRAFRVIWMCCESQIPFEHLATGGELPLPAMEDGGFVLREPSAINLHLAQKYPNRLWPTTLEAQARVLQWSFFVARDVDRLITAVYRHRFGLPREERNAALADDCERRLLELLRVLEAQLGRGDYFGGVRWDLSDFMIASTLYTVYAMKLDLHPLPKLDRWLTRSVQRPAAREAIKRLD